MRESTVLDPPGDTCTFSEHPPPDTRTAAESVLQGQESKEYSKALLRHDRGFAQSRHPKKKSGIYECCPFHHLDYFNIIRDFLMDVMHMYKNLACRIVELVTGNLEPAVPAETAESNDTEKGKKQRVNWARITRVPAPRCIIIILIVHYTQHIDCADGPWHEADRRPAEGIETVV